MPSMMISLQQSFPVDSGIIPVHSCFGPMAIYKRSAIQDCYYDSLEEDCEHVSFHKCLRDHGGNMTLNSAMMVRYRDFPLPATAAPTMPKKKKNSISSWMKKLFRVH